MSRPIARALVGVVALLALVNGSCLFDEELKHDLGVVPAELGDGWAIATPESVGISSATLAGIHAVLLREDRFLGSLGLLVVKDEKLVFETYLRTMADRDHVHHVQSVTKSVTALAFGVARADGRFGSLDETVSELFADKTDGLSAEKTRITLSHLLTMRSGLEFENVDFSLEMWTDRPEDPLRYMLEKPLASPPGGAFHYHDCDPQLVGHAIERRVGVSERALVSARLFGPLGIGDWYWDSGPGGVTMAAHGLHLRPRDLAKLGQLVVDRGAYRGAQIVPSAWVDEMTRAQVATDSLDASGAPFSYGYYWWVFDGGVAAWGNGGQFIVLSPHKRQVIVHVALPDTAGLDGSRLGEFLELVAPLL